MKSNSASLDRLGQLLCLCAEDQVLKKAVFSKPADKNLSRATAVLKDVGGKRVLQWEYLQTDHKAVHVNTDWTRDSVRDRLEGWNQINLLTVAGDCEYRRSKSGNEVLLGDRQLEKRLKESTPEIKVDPQGNNRIKNRILTGKERFLHELGVSDAQGRVYDKKQSKFRQINRFLELVSDIVPSLPKDEVHICDLCCGKSYLSFAVYYYFTEVLKRPVVMYGVDLKADVIEHCRQVAGKMHMENLRFLCQDIRDFSLDGPVDLVVSLHACDTATDLVLHKAVEWDAKVILSTPCCHHELNHHLDCPELSFISDYSMLRQKLCDAATDALRLKWLEAKGYRTEALELIDPDETPKNIMLRAVKKANYSPSSEETRRALQAFSEAKAFLIRSGAVPKEEKGYGLFSC